DMRFSFLLGDRPYLVYVSGETEREGLIRQRDEAQASMDNIKGKIADTQRRLQTATDPEEVADLQQRLQELNESGRSLREARDRYHTLWAEMAHRGRLLDPTDFYYGIQGEFFPHGTGFGVTSRVKAYGMPIRAEERISGFDERLIGLKDRGKVRLAPPTRYEFLNNVAWNYRNILELGYSGVVLWDPGFWRLQSHLGVAYLAPADFLRLGGEMGILVFHNSFEDYVEAVTNREGFDPAYPEAVTGALDQLGILRTSVMGGDVWKRAGLYVSPFDWMSVGAASDFKGDYRLRLRGALRGCQWNIAAALAEERAPQMSFHVTHVLGENVAFQASAGKDSGGWRIGAGIQIGTSAAKDGATRVAFEEASLLPSELIARALSLKTGLDSSLFIEKIKLLDPKTRNLIGKISDKVTLPEAAKGAIRDGAISAEEVMKLYTLLGHYFDGASVQEQISLGEGLKAENLGKIDLDAFKDLGAPEDLLQEMMGVVFGPEQMGALEGLRQRALEASTTARQL
ncbi:MAG: hypothetical protein ABH845_03835, partial [Candidatus Omnitrophota bacterium]